LGEVDSSCRVGWPNTREGVLLSTTLGGACANSTRAEVVKNESKNLIQKIPNQMDWTREKLLPTTSIMAKGLHQQRNAKLRIMWFRILAIFCLALSVSAIGTSEARDKQDLETLRSLSAKAEAAANRAASDAKLQYQYALAKSVEAEVAMEKGDKRASAAAAEAGIAAARKAVSADANNAEYHRLLGTLCGQVIPANVIAGFKYGRCALDEVAKALELNPKAAENWLARGVGNYYLPPSFGGGLDKSLADLDKAIQLNPKLADAYLWKGIVLRKAAKNSEARKALAKALELNPKRVWARTQLDKTPAQ
jgi:Flp pilus assembly protein TadD